MVTVAVVSLLFALVIERDTLVLSLSAVPAILYLGVAATGLVFGLQTWAQRHTTPTRTALIFVLEPVFAAIFALIFTQERLAGLEWLGGGLILVGMLVAELRIFNLTRLGVKQQKIYTEKIAKITH
jgi:drug/metabolite transporter (DMT)-like permease